MNAELKGQLEILARAIEHAITAFEQETASNVVAIELKRNADGGAKITVNVG